MHIAFLRQFTKERAFLGLFGRVLKKVLIPKIDNHESLKNFRPISLCNVIYKVITKILANRIKPYMDYLIASNHCSFVSGRHSSGNIIITEEGFMVVKLDLEYAYDRLSCDFLKETLEDIDFSPHFINIVMKCVSS